MGLPVTSELFPLPEHGKNVKICFLLPQYEADLRLKVRLLARLCHSLAPNIGAL